MPDVGVSEGIVAHLTASRSERFEGGEARDAVIRAELSVKVTIHSPGPEETIG